MAEIVLRQGGRDHVRATAVLGDLDTLDGPDLEAVTPSVPPLAQCISLGDRPGPGGMDRRRSSDTSTSAWPPISGG